MEERPRPTTSHRWMRAGRVASRSPGVWMGQARAAPTGCCMCDGGPWRKQASDPPPVILQERERTMVIAAVVIVVMALVVWGGL
jgi:hypothetical protein